MMSFFVCLFVLHDVDYGLPSSILLSKYMYFSSNIKACDDLLERESLLVKANTYTMLSYTQSPDLTTLSRLVLGSEPSLSLRMKASEHRIKRW
ncbi:hypothetical protein AMTRI_Chr01g130300 [Amborella trichopoda]